MPFTKQQLTAFALGAILAGSVAGVLFVYSLAQQYRVEIALELLRSERDLTSIQTIKAMNSIRQGKDVEAIRFMEVWVGGQLKIGASDESLGKAKEYQRAYCKDKCLGIE